MNLALLLPAGLAALAALLLPLLVHLARRSEQRPTPFAALRHLTARARPRRHVRFDEWPLLVLRLLLVAALALLLARPVLLGAADATPWTLVAPGVDPARVLPAATEGDTAAAGERRWLAPGFPPLASAMPAARVPVSSLLRELDATLPAGAPVTVHVPPLLDGVDAERPQLSRAVRWMVAAPEALVDDSATRGLAPRPPMPTLVVRHAPDRAPALRYLRASAVAWQAMDGGEDAVAAEGFDAAPMEAPLPADVTLLAWLAPGPLPAAVLARVDDGAVALVDADATWPGRDPAAAVDAWRTADGELLLREHPLGRGRVLQWTRALRPDALPALLDPEFAARLRAALMPPPPAPAVADGARHAPRTGAPAWAPPPRPLAPWLLWLVAALFALERWVATGPRRRSPA